jgi:hypothetical protein
MTDEVLAERLRLLAAQIRFKGGETARPAVDGAMVLSVSRLRGGSTRHLLTIAMGLPAPPEARGLHFRLHRADSTEVIEGHTDRRGQIEWAGLVAGAEYTLEFVD